MVTFVISDVLLIMVFPLQGVYGENEHEREGGERMKPKCKRCRFIPTTHEYMFQKMREERYDFCIVCGHKKDGKG